MSFNNQQQRDLGVPGGGGITTASNYALFYQQLLHNDLGIWDADVLADATVNVRNTFGDPLFNTPANRALGVVVAGDDGKASMRGFGKTQFAAHVRPRRRRRSDRVGRPGLGAVVRLPDQRLGPAHDPRGEARRCAVVVRAPSSTLSDP